MEEDKDYYKQFPCKRFKTGECPYGDECKYSHDVNLNIGKRKQCENDNECSSESHGKSEDLME